MYKGIDYGNGLTNINLITGIRYGVIPMKEISNMWYDESKPIYFYSCPFCGSELKKGIEAKRCPDCYHKITEFDFDFLEPSNYIYNKNGYEAHSDNDSIDIWKIRSPFYTYSQFCSPCAPGAGYLMNSIDEKDLNNKTYCFDKDWFEDKIPYDIYDVKTNELVFSKST